MLTRVPSCVVKFRLQDLANQGIPTKRNNSGKQLAQKCHVVLISASVCPSALVNQEQVTSRVQIRLPLLAVHE